MTTSSEQITNLIGGYTDLKQYFEDARDNIDARLNSVASRWDDFETIWHVDQIAGDDTAQGTADSPLANIQQAIDRTPYGKRASVRIRGDYATTQRYTPRNRHVSLLGCDAEWNYAPINMHLGYEVDSFNRFRTFGFSGEYNSSWDLYNINLKAKTATELTTAHPEATFNATLSPIFARTRSIDQLAGGVFLRHVDIDITADPYATLFNAATWRFEFFGVTQTNPLSGYFVEGVSAGTPTSSVALIQSNISTL